jgi:hypothetical protein
MHVSGLSQATTANANAVTDESTAGGPTVEASLTSLNLLKAPKANATMTGTTTLATLAVGTAATVPTVSVGDTDTSAASTAFVMQAVGLVVQVADDAAAAILNTTAALYLAGTTLLAAKEIATTSARANQVVRIRMVAAVLGTYTLPVSEGTLTFTDAGAHAVVIRNAAGDAWLVLDPGTATIV